MSSSRIPDWYRLKSQKHPSSSSYIGSNNNNTTTAFALALVSVAVSYAAYEFHRSVQDYGWEGTVRYVWEGDPYEPKLRECVTILEESEYNLNAFLINDRLCGLEESLNIATSLSSSTKSSTTATTTTTTTDTTTSSVKRTLADLSYSLDKIAARVDGIVLSSSSTSHYLTQQIKKRKKVCSKSIVILMERCDALLASFQVLKEKPRR
ncbi:hypothetical protein FRACYDRAFT_241965 [Fragilariopsis cylindrus CCMP1102]|uniref:Uncharacterized protein n=1 Tax=Fragilariopsis cylindrus CCMP1102 TaxID=635003 RepID=A0A1E7F681_9STRA|nr:hypothetical protein FRACYDRAFT_241965 [Fragilariopsis cylindrus CCMP1102]|eukprot:OEU13624.1 hypothetical protein FRACYDRAFT_241965 [Fragilariopsis cylindrus CCMP1102]